MLSEPDFHKLFCKEFELDPTIATPDAFLVDDLGFDSFDLFRLSIVLELLLPGFELPEQFSIKDVRVESVYYYYSLEASRVSSDETRGS